jgi:SAM-dependent methyltransferase
MSLSDEYRQQRAWRPWPQIFGLLPDIAGQTVLDLGCAIGDQATELVARGATVIGVDANEELLDVARARQIPRAEFRSGDIARLSLSAHVDGIWSSFAAAYLPDLVTVLRRWRDLLRSGGWLLMTEVDDLFGHEPVAEQTKNLLDGFAASTFAAGRYDFHMGRKLQQHLKDAGFILREQLELEDRELAFQGAAAEDVVAAWRARFGRMHRLQQFCGARFDEVRDDFVQCLMLSEHRSRAKVRCCAAVVGR